jgi:hypothetical protein
VECQQPQFPFQRGRQSLISQLTFQRTDKSLVGDTDRKRKEIEKLSEENKELVKQNSFNLLTNLEINAER